MKKSYLIYLLIGVAIIGGITGFYFISLQNQESIVESKKLTLADKPPATAKVGTTAVTDNADRAGEESGEEKGEKAVYTYRKSFKNPFADYRQNKVEAVEVASSNAREGAEKSLKALPQGETITAGKLKANLPFRLKGIIGSDQKWLAIIEVKGEAEIFRPQDSVAGYKIVEIREDSLILSYKGINFKIEMESGSGGS